MSEQDQTQETSVLDSVKKTMRPLVEFLMENSNKKVSTIIDDVVEMCTAKSRGGSGGAPREKTFILNANNEVVAIKDYYFKRWMPLVGELAVKFGLKASSSTGYAPMCTEGTSHWTKQQNEAKKASEQILADVEAGELNIADIAERRAEIEAERTRIVETDLGFATKDEVIAYLEEIGEDLSDPEPVEEVEETEEVSEDEV